MTGKELVCKQLQYFAYMVLLLSFSCIFLFCFFFTQFLYFTNALYSNEYIFT